MFQSIKHPPSTGNSGPPICSGGGGSSQEEWQSIFYPVFHYCVMISCSLSATSGGAQAGATSGCRQQPGRVISQWCGHSVSLLLLPFQYAHQLLLPGKSWSPYLAHCYKQLPDISLLDQVIPWRLGDMESPLSCVNELCVHLTCFTNAGWCGAHLPNCHFYTIATRQCIYLLFSGIHILPGGFYFCPIFPFGIKQKGSGK